MFIARDPVKRVVDLLIALPALVLMSPLILVAATAVKLTSSGPAINRQLRVGRGERPFTCYKLRTMHIGTPIVPTHEASTAAVTPIGRWLRKSKIDELPQLWNVILGGMSLVGPRPCLPHQSALIGWRRKLGVFSLRPGITGLAQVRGIDMSRPELCAHTDAEYLGAQSFALDIALMCRTLVPSSPAPSLPQHNGPVARLDHE